MIIIITLLTLIALFGLLDLAALKWGKNSRRGSLASHGYDPREDWNSPS